MQKQNCSWAGVVDSDEGVAALPCSVSVKGAVCSERLQQQQEMTLKADL